MPDAYTGSSLTASETSGAAGDALELPLSSMASPSQSSRHPLVTTRIGTLFVVAALCALACGVAASSVPQLRGFQSMMWVATVAVCSLNGLIAMRSVRTLRTIETELRHSGGKPER